MVQIAPPPRRRDRESFQQTYSWLQRLKANIYDVETTLAFVILFVVLVINLVYLAQQQRHGYDLSAIGTGLISQLTLQGLTNANDTPGRVITIINALFYILFAQTVLQNIQLFADRKPATHQLGLASTMRDHVIVCGLGRVGYRIVSRLAASGYRVVAIQQNYSSEFVNRTIEHGIPVVSGDAREESTLNRALIRRARAVIACIDGDLVNLEIVLAAKRLNPDVQVILRAFNEDFDSGFESSFGAHTAFSASKLAAPTFAGAALVRNIEQVITLEREQLGVAQVRLTGEMNAASVEQTNGVRVLPGAAGNTLAVIAPLATLADLNVRAGGQAISGDGSIIVCGLGKVGYRVVQLLRETYPDRRIVVIHLPEGVSAEGPRDGNAVDEAVGRSFTKMIANLPGVELIPGDARDRDLLLRAGVERASAVMALTSDDQSNVQIGLEARNIRADVHVVLRVFSGDLAEKLGELFKIRTVFSTSDLASPTMAAAAILGGIDGAFAVGNDLYAISEVAVTAQHRFANATVEALRRRDALVVRLVRANAVHLLPSLTMGILPGDTVTVIAPLKTLDRLRAA